MSDPPSGAARRDLDVERRLARLEKQADDVEVWRRNVIELAAQQRETVSANTRAIEALGQHLDRLEANASRLVWLVAGAILSVGVDIATHFLTR